MHLLLFLCSIRGHSWDRARRHGIAEGKICEKESSWKVLCTKHIKCNVLVWPQHHTGHISDNIVVKYIFHLFTILGGKKYRLTLLYQLKHIMFWTVNKYDDDQKFSQYFLVRLNQHFSRDDDGKELGRKRSSAYYLSFFFNIKYCSNFVGIRRDVAWHAGLYYLLYP